MHIDTRVRKAHEWAMMNLRWHRSLVRYEELTEPTSSAIRMLYKPEPKLVPHFDEATVIHAVRVGGTFRDPTDGVPVTVDFDIERS